MLNSLCLARKAGLVSILMAACVFAEASNPALKANGSLLQFAPGNAVRITTAPDTAAFLNGVYIIDSEGRVDLPIIGFLKISDKTYPELEALLAKKYIDYLRYPNVQARPMVRAGLIGGFRAPGLYWVDPRENMWDLVMRAGGPIREDGIKKIRWERDSGLVSNNITPHFQSGQSLYAVGFRSGDQLTVTGRPKTNFSEVFGTNILPILSLVISATSSVVMIYFSTQTYNNNNRTP
jgi:protein involved in polysaccharide export with SLBB domain